jgi:divalent metal cation (Fe/Co/Zn/Cd) transporter
VIVVAPGRPRRAYLAGATRRYTYGFGRAEDLAGVLIVVVIAGYEAIRRLLHLAGVSHPRIPDTKLSIGSLAAGVLTRLLAGYRAMYAQDPWYTSDTRSSQGRNATPIPSRQPRSSRTGTDGRYR